MWCGAERALLIGPSFLVALVDQLLGAGRGKDIGEVQIELPKM